MMPSGLFILVAFSSFVIIVGIGLLVWGVRSGQFRNVEEAKFTMLEDREPEPWPTKSREGRHD